MAANLTIDELAREAGVTSRNIRAYQTRGLLPSPRMEGRVGYYDDNHLARLRYIASLQERGFSLAAIQCLLEAWDQGRGLNEVLGFEEALNAPWSDETPELVSIEWRCDAGAGRCCRRIRGARSPQSSRACEHRTSIGSWTSRAC